jgi:hypothetical protein
MAIVISPRLSGILNWRSLNRENPGRVAQKENDGDQRDEQKWQGDEKGCDQGALTSRACRP